MDQMGDTAAQRSKLIHYLIRLCVTILAAWLIAAWSNELLVNLFVSHKIG